VLPVVQLLALLHQKSGGKLAFVPGVTVCCLPEEEVISQVTGPVISINETRRHEVPEELREAFAQAREIDVAGSVDGQLIVAEVKSSGQYVQEQEIRTCLQVAEQFEHSRVIFACSDSFPEAAETAVRKSAQDIGYPEGLIEFYEGNRLMLPEE